MTMRLVTSLVLALLGAAALAIAVPFASGQDKDPTLRNLDDYRLRVGDRIQVLVYNANKTVPESQATLSVPGNGDVSVPPIGKIHLLDRTVFDVQEAVAQKYKDLGF